jgi:HD-GYP domain-containing protein (c-di-GMP phosphodiesterase class II)
MRYVDHALYVALDEKDGYTASHCVRVADLAEALGRTLNIAEEDLRSLHDTGLVHDVGKIGIPDGVLLKHSHLDAHEWEIMKTHSVRGERILKAQSLAGGAVLDKVIKAVRHHHEHIDGSGYPDGLSGEEIPIWSRILLVADSYDAMTTPRAYRRALAHDEVMGIMKGEVGTRSDPLIFDAFAHLMESSPLQAMPMPLAESNHLMHD